MLRNTSLAVLAVLLVAVSSQAATINVTDSPTVGLAGFRTFTLTANADASEKVIGFNFVGAGELGFTGAMSQIQPFGPTVFSDSNAAFPLVGADVSQDSQFKVNSTKGLPVSASESANHLRGAFNYNAASIVSDASNVFAFAQICTNATINYIGDLTIRNAAGVDRLERFTGTLGGTQVVAPIAVSTNLPDRIQGAVITHLFTTSAGTAPITWENLVINGPGALLNAPTLTSGGDFSWNSHGSPYGDYTFSATARNSAGTSVGTLSIELIVPEPATMSLVGLAMIGLVGLGRRRS